MMTTFREFRNNMVDVLPDLPVVSEYHFKIFKNI